MGYSTSQLFKVGAHSLELRGTSNNLQRLQSPHLRPNYKPPARALEIVGGAVHLPVVQLRAVAGSCHHALLATGAATFGGGVSLAAPLSLHGARLRRASRGSGQGRVSQICSEYSVMERSLEKKPPADTRGGTCWADVRAIVCGREGGGERIASRKELRVDPGFPGRLRIHPMCHACVPRRHADRFLMRPPHLRQCS